MSNPMHMWMVHDIARWVLADLLWSSARDECGLEAVSVWWQRAM